MRPMFALIFLTMVSAQDAPDAWAFIDPLIDKRLAEKKIEASPLADDFEFLRRISLDVIGRTPRVAAQAWMSSKDRDKLVDSLLESKEYADFWSEVWVKALLGFDVFNLFRQDMDYGKLREWLREQLGKNRRYDEMVHELLTAEGDFKQNPPVNFLMGYIKNDTKQPVEAAVAVSRVFLGYQLQCAQCHDHPFDLWTKAQFWSYTAMLARTRQKVSNTFDGVKIKLVDRDTGELKTEDGEIAPRHLDGRDLADANRRHSLARWILGNRQFARATVNRVWAHFMGTGLVDPIDRFSDSNPPSHPELLEKLSDAFIASHFDLKALIRGIVTSKAYQRTSRGEQKRDRLYARQTVRPMHPVALLNSLIYALGAEQFAKNEDFQKMRYLLYTYIQSLLGQNNKSDRANYEGSAQQALVFMNNKDWNAAIQAPGGIVDVVISKGKTPAEKIQAMVFLLLTRPATPEELSRFETYLKSKKYTREAYRDVYWVLLNSNEWFFNH